MKILEQILQEIDKKINEVSAGESCGLYVAKDIIRSHMEDDGWINDRLPVMEEYMNLDTVPYMRRLEIAYMTDTVEYIIGYYDGYKWMDKHHDLIGNVVAWKIHNPYIRKDD